MQISSTRVTRLSATQSWLQLKISRSSSKLIVVKLQLYVLFIVIIKVSLIENYYRINLTSVLTLRILRDMCRSYTISLQRRVPSIEQRKSLQEAKTIISRALLQRLLLRLRFRSSITRYLGFKYNACGSSAGRFTICRNSIEKFLTLSISLQQLTKYKIVSSLGINYRSSALTLFITSFLGIRIIESRSKSIERRLRRILGKTSIVSAIALFLSAQLCVS